MGYGIEGESHLIFLKGYVIRFGLYTLHLSFKVKTNWPEVFQMKATFLLLLLTDRSWLKQAKARGFRKIMLGSDSIAAKDLSQLGSLQITRVKIWFNKVMQLLKVRKSDGSLLLGSKPSSRCFGQPIPCE
ncbi:hypothetical protein RJT34_30613 [Clitoria ternatea]|uniref:Uncharacterized protein n=1 Tax=Clitoria ternatea TaxID=43366 RepID=A0AAN9ETT5_CLITE